MILLQTLQYYPTLKMTSYSYNSSSSSLIILTLAIIQSLLFFSPTCSTSTIPTISPPKPGFRVALHHVDSGKNLTKFELLDRAINRDKLRLQRLNASNNLQSPVQAGDGDYLMKLAIGTPPLDFPAVVDSGSDLIWTQCKPCTECFNQSTPIFDPEKSSTYAMLPCSSNLCKTENTECTDNSCNYVYQYGDYTSTKGTMGTETFTFQDVLVPNIGFGCGNENEGNISPASGVIGLGRGPLSLVSQLKEPTFSYCLTSIDDQTSTSTLFMGLKPNKMDNPSAMKTTPLYSSPSHPTFYYLNLSGVSLGDVEISVDESLYLATDEEGISSGGMIIDSGTTLTYLEQSLFDAIVKEFTSQTKLQPNNWAYLLNYNACFYAPAGTDKVEYPKIVFHFEGADLEVPAENYVVEENMISYGSVCLALGTSGTSDSMQVLGNLMQQNMLVVYDLDKEELSFMPTKCGQM